MGTVPGVFSSTGVIGIQAQRHRGGVLKIYHYERRCTNAIGNSRTRRRKMQWRWKW
jgi:hypothetical protein